MEQLSLTGEPQQLTSADFDQWWAGYPIKRDKAFAHKKYRTVRRRGASPEALTRARDHYLSQATPGFIKYPATFLSVWEEWAVPESPPVPEPTLPARTEVRFCTACGELVDWCSCGVTLHRWFTRP